MKPLEPRKYPVGIQVFSMIRNEHYLYVDKTDMPTASICS